MLKLQLLPPFVSVSDVSSSSSLLVLSSFLLLLLLLTPSSLPAEEMMISTSFALVLFVEFDVSLLYKVWIEQSYIWPSWPAIRGSCMAVGNVRS